MVVVDGADQQISRTVNQDFPRQSFLTPDDKQMQLASFELSMDVMPCVWLCSSRSANEMISKMHCDVMELCRAISLRFVLR